MREKTLMAGLNVARLLGRLGRQREKISILDDIHVCLLSEHGMYHEDCLRVRVMMGEASEALGRRQECLDILKEVMDRMLGEREKYGVEILGLHLDVAELYLKMGMGSESSVVSKRVESILKAERDLRCLQNGPMIADLFERLGKLEDSYLTVKHFYLHTYFDGDGYSILRFANILSKLGRHQEALEVFKMAEHESNRRNGDFHWNAMEAKMGISECLEKLGKKKESQEISSEVLYILKVDSEVRDELTWKETSKYSLLLEKLGEKDEGYQRLIDAHENMMQIEGEKGELVLEIKKDMAEMLERMEKLDEALVIFEKVYYTRKEMECVLEVAEPTMTQKGRCAIS